MCPKPWPNLLAKKCWSITILVIKYKPGLTPSFLKGGEGTFLFGS